LFDSISLDPSYARAMALAAFCYATRLDQGWMSDQQAETIEGLRLAVRAIHLAKDDGSLHRKYCRRNPTEAATGRDGAGKA
jgi:hypothetical protein